MENINLVLVCQDINGMELKVNVFVFLIAIVVVSVIVQPIVQIVRLHPIMMKDVHVRQVMVVAALVKSGDVGRNTLNILVIA